MNSFLLFAQSAAQSGESGAASSPYTMVILLGVFMVAFYFLTIRPQKKKQKEEQEMRSSLEIGDEIVTIGGIIGRVVTIKENDLIIETGSDRNKMKIERWAINTNKTKAEQHQKEVEAAREAAKAKKAEKKSKKEVIDETKGKKED